MFSMGVFFQTITLKMDILGTIFGMRLSFDHKCQHYDQKILRPSNHCWLHQKVLVWHHNYPDTSQLFVEPLIWDAVWNYCPRYVWVLDFYFFRLFHSIHNNFCLRFPHPLLFVQLSLTGCRFLETVLHFWAVFPKFFDMFHSSARICSMPLYRINFKFFEWSA